MHSQLKAFPKPKNLYLKHLFHSSLFLRTPQSISKEIADDDMLPYYMYNTELILSVIVFLHLWIPFSLITSVYQEKSRKDVCS